jgi:hypothetical protein
MAFTMSEETMDWLQSHKEAILETANVFLRYVVDAQDPIKRPHTGDVGTQEPPFSWDGDDQKKEALIALIFVHRVVGRYLPCAILCRLLAVASNFECGTEPLKILRTLLDANIVTLARDPDEPAKNQDSMMDLYVHLSTEALQILTGLSLPEEEDAEEEEAPLKFSDLPREVTKTSTPLLLAKLGMSLRKKTPSYIGFPKSSSKDSKERLDHFIEQAAKVLTRRLRQIQILESRLDGASLDATSTKVIALLFSKKMASSFADLDDVSSAMRDAEEGLEAVRRTRNGSPLVLGGIVESTHKSHVELCDEIFDLLLSIDDEEGTTSGTSPLMLFENRIKATTTKRKPNGGDDLDGEYVFRTN